MLERLAREYRRLPPAYWTLWWGTLINKAGGFVLVFLALYVTRRGGSEADAGVILALYGAGTTLAGLFGGVLADRVGRRFTMLLSLFGGAVALLAMGTAESLPVLGASTFFTGLLAELYRPAVSAAIADVVPPADRPRAYAYLYWAINMGFAIAPTLGGLLTSFSYFALFAADAATLAAFGVIVASRVRETRPASTDEPGAPGGLGVVLRDRLFIGFCALCLGLAMVLWQNGSMLPLDMRRHGISAATYGLLLGFNGAMIVFLQPALASRVAAWPRTAVLAWSSLFFGAGHGLYGVVSTPAGYALAIALWTLAEIAALPTASAVVADIAPAALRGRYQGLYAMSVGIASCVGPLAGGSLLAGVGGRALWFGCFGLMVLVTVGHLLLGPARSRREQAARNAQKA